MSRVLELIAEHGRDLVAARRVLIMLQRGDELVVAATAGQLDRDLVGFAVPIDASTAGAALSSLGSIRRVEASELIVRPERLGGSAKAVMYVPLRFRGRGVGVIAAFDPGEQRGFTQDDEMLMRAFAASAATAVVTTQSFGDERVRERVRASEDERGRWSRDLHDQTLQGLIALHLTLSSALDEPAPDRLRKRVQQATDMIAGELESLREIIADLRPPALDDLGLGPAIEAMVQRRRGVQLPDLRVQVELQFELGRCERRLLPDIETTAYRLLQEALSNVARHAQAATVDIRVLEQGDEVHILVHDDGVGFEPGVTRQGLGLSGMFERAALVAGTLEITSTPGAGTSVRAALPALHRDD